MGINIRSATHDDIPQMLKLGREMHQETYYSKFEYNEEKVKTLIDDLLILPQGIVIVAEEDYEIHGGIIAQCHEQWFGPTLIATDYAFFLSRAHRGNRTAHELLHEYKKRARALGAKVVQVAISSGINEIHADRLMYQVGARKSGFAYEL